ncbi:MAG TPA: TonB-dependent receptor [Acidobacteriota bacterium]
MTTFAPRVRLFALILVSILTPPELSGQSARGSLTGLVRDASGAVLPGVNVVAQNQETNINATFTTGETGNYEFTSLIPGKYTVTAELPGFKKAELTGVEVNVGSRVRLDVELQVGEISQTVNVLAEGVSLIPSETATMGQLVTNKQIVDLPLVSRNFMQLLSLSAEVTRPVGGIQSLLRTDQSGGSISVAGARVSSNSFSIDGVANNDPAFQTPSVTPSIDAIQEFQVQTGFYNAEFGNGAGQVNIGIKSGTNKIHGSVFDFLRNDALQPYLPHGTFRNPLTGGKLRNKLRYNQFGGTVGGPIFRDHSFFFFNYEGRRQRNGAFGLAVVPTQAMRLGDFSGLPQIYDPLTTRPNPNMPGTFIRDPFLNNQIPANRIAEVSKKLLDFFPAANLGTRIGPNNYGGQVTSSNDINQYTARVDHRLSESDNIFGRFTWSGQDISPLALLPFTGSLDEQRGRNAGLQYNHIFSPRLVNEARYGLNKSFYFRGFETGLDQASLGLKNISRLEGGNTLPVVSMTGFSSIGFGGSITNTETLTHQVIDNLSWIRGKHAYKFGAEFRRNRNLRKEQFQSNGLLQFLGNFSNLPGTTNTGSAFADFLLGYPQNVALAPFGSIADVRANDVSWFFQDDWKITPRLTLNYGMRWEYHGAGSDKTGGGRVMDLTTPGGRQIVSDAGYAKLVNNFRITCCVDPMLVGRDLNNFAPRLGLAWRPLGGNEFVVRAGYGVFYDIVSQYYYWGFRTQLLTKTVLPINLGPVATPVNIDTLFNPAQDISALADVPLNLSGVEASQRDPYTQHWTLLVGHQVSSNMYLEAGYLGTKSTKLPWQRLFNQALVPSTDPTNRPQTRVPYKDLGPGSFVLANELSAHYHAFTSKIERRFSDGLAFLGSYVFSKSIDAGSSDIFAFAGSFNLAQNNHDIRGERGLSNLDVPHRFVVSWIYEFPFGRNKRWLDGAGLLSHFFGGWQFNGIFSVQSGYPFSVVHIGDRSNTGALGRERAQQVGDPFPEGFKQTSLRWFDPAAFALPVFGTFGNTARNILRGPYIRNTDVSVLKNTALGERVNVQFRAEFFNVFSERLHRGVLPGNSVQVPATFGRIGTRDELFNPRVIQFGLKVLF